MSKLNGKVSVVTGGSSGIGLASAKRFAAEGARVFITGRRPAELEQARQEIGAAASVIQADVSDLGDLDKIFEMVGKEAGRVDVLMLNAAFAEFQPVGGISIENYETTFNTNVRGVIFGLQKALPLLAPGSPS